MLVTIRTRKKINKFKVIDYDRKMDLEFAFKSGNLFYFKKDRYNYIVATYIAQDDVYMI